LKAALASLELELPPRFDAEDADHEHPPGAGDRGDRASVPQLEAGEGGD
jgi:hypothetical protein